MRKPYAVRLSPAEVAAMQAAAAAADLTFSDFLRNAGLAAAERWLPPGALGALLREEAEAARNAG